MMNPGCVCLFLRVAGPGVARVPFRVIASIGVCRLVILPLLGVGMVMGAYAAGIFTAPDPIFLLVLLIQVDGGVAGCLGLAVLLIYAQLAASAIMHL